MKWFFWIRFSVVSLVCIGAFTSAAQPRRRATARRSVAARRQPVRPVGAPQRVQPKAPPAAPAISRSLPVGAEAPAPAPLSPEVKQTSIQRVANRFKISFREAAFLVEYSLMRARRQKITPEQEARAARIGKVARIAVPVVVAIVIGIIAVTKRDSIMSALRRRGTVEVSPPAAAAADSGGAVADAVSQGATGASATGAEEEEDEAAAEVREAAAVAARSSAGSGGAVADALGVSAGPAPVPTARQVARFLGFVKEGDGELVADMLAENPALASAVDQDGNSALIIAASHGKRGIVQQLIPLLKVEQVNHVGKGGATALMWAAAQGHLPVVNDLLKVEGIDIHRGNNRGKTAYDLVRELAQTDQQRWIRDRWYREVLARLVPQFNSGDLIEAVGDNDVAEVRRLLDLGARPSDGGTHGSQETALMLAASRGKEEIFELLLPHVTPQEINRGDASGETALMKAVAGKHAGIVSKLLDVPGVNPNVLHKSDATALDVAKAVDASDIVERLQAAGGKTAVETAEQKGDLKKADFIRFMRAAMQGDEQQVAALLDSRPGLIDMQDAMGFTALIAAAESNKPGIVQLLLQKGADTTKRTNLGQTAEDRVAEGRDRDTWATIMQLLRDGVSSGGSGKDEAE